MSVNFHALLRLRHVTVTVELGGPQTQIMTIKVLYLNSIIGGLQFGFYSDNFGINVCRQINNELFTKMPTCYGIRYFGIAIAHQ